MKVIITGGAGFIGSNLVEYFNRNSPGTEITVVDDLSTGRLENLNGLAAEFIEGDITDLKFTEEVLAGGDAVVHLGALGSVPRSIENPLRSHDVNVNGTLNVLEATRKNHTHVVFASSSSVYGANTKLPKNELDWTRPVSPYGVTKLAAEGYVLAYRETYNLPSLVFRFFNVFGPKQAADHAYAAVIPRFLHAALTGVPLQVHGDGAQSRDFTYVGTVCQAIFDAVTRRVVSDTPVNLALGSNTSLMELIDIIKSVAGMELQIEHTEPRAGDVRASQADGILLRELFPETQSFPLADGIANTISWFQSTGKYADTC